LNYILAGFAGCAATPRLVWQFEELAIWSLIKFLAAFGGISVANAVGIHAIDRTAILDVDRRVNDLLSGILLVELAFGVAFFQVYALEFARALGDASKKPNSLLYRVHRFFTRNLPPHQNKVDPQTEIVISAAITIVNRWTVPMA
jgi:hypothetical protein